MHNQAKDKASIYEYMYATYPSAWISASVDNFLE